MDISFSYFAENMAGNPILIITVLLTPGRYLRQRMDRRPERDRDLCDDKMLKSAQGDPHECGVQFPGCFYHDADQQFSCIYDQ